MKSILLFLILFSVCLTSYSQLEKNYKYGLSFKSHSENLDARTSLNLTPYRPIRNLDEGFTISFEMKLRKESQTFGYVFRMIVDEKSSFDFVSNLTEDELSFLINDANNQEVKSTRLVDPKLVSANYWIPTVVSFYHDRTEILVNNKKVFLRKGFKHFRNIEFLFGANNSKYFHTTEVPPITLRNIRIRNNGYLTKHWVLGKHNNGQVYDEVNNALATVKSPVWEINKHSEWEKNAILNFKTQPQIAFDKKGGRVFMVSDKSILVYKFATNKVDTIQVMSGNSYKGVSRQIVYNPKKDELLSYTIQNPRVYSFSFKTKSWSGAPDTYIDSRQHHNVYLDTNQNSLTMMFGYGYHKYSNELNTLQLDANDDNWKSINLNPALSPRYLSAMGCLDKDNVLLLGGFGSKSGRQEEFPKHKYDLNKINLKTGKTEQLWELKLDSPYLVFSNSMFIDTAKNKAFALGYSNFTYKSSISLYSFDIKTQKPELKKLSPALPFNFLDIESYCDLFYDAKKERLFALASSKLSNNTYEVKLYSVAYPVFEANEIYQGKPNYSLNYVVGGAILLVLGLMFSLFKKKKVKVKQQVVKEEMLVSALGGTEDKEVLKNILTINLLGDFQFKSKDGVDRTGEFTPILKQIFLFLLLHSLEKEKVGLSSHLLDQTFWQGMSQDKAVNNRSVNIRKLRILLSSFADIEIVNKNTYWFLKFNEEFVCDYQLVNLLLTQMSEEDTQLTAKVNNLIKLCKGKLLPSIEQEWVDDFKSKFGSVLNKALLEALKYSTLKGNHFLRLQITDIVLLYDSFDDNAITYKINLLYKSGQKGQSKLIFEKYTQEYAQTFQSPSSLNYKEIILLDI